MCVCMGDQVTHPCPTLRLQRDSVRVSAQWFRPLMTVHFRGYGETARVCLHSGQNQDSNLPRSYHRKSSHWIQIISCSPVLSYPLSYPGKTVLSYPLSYPLYYPGKTVFSYPRSVVLPGLDSVVLPAVSATRSNSFPVHQCPVSRSTSHCECLFSLPLSTKDAGKSPSRIAKIVIF